MKLVLIGGEEFAPGFEDVHSTLLSPLRDGQSRGVFLPTCASHDGLEVVKYWANLAREKLSPVCASVEAPLVIDTESANRTDYANAVAAADWIYIGGGYPHIGLQILTGTRVMDELLRAAARGALILGASAGAMMMCAQSIVISPEFLGGQGKPQPLVCLGFVPNSVCAPHFNRSFSQRWIEDHILPDGFTLIGIDEQTALASVDGTWRVYGHGSVSLFRKGGQLVQYAAGQWMPGNEAPG